LMTPSRHSFLTDVLDKRGVDLLAVKGRAP
jgi:hypothetical protein